MDQIEVNRDKDQVGGDLPGSMADALEAAAEAFRWAEGLLVTAGAGTSVDSGLPAFRSPRNPVSATMGQGDRQAEQTTNDNCSLTFASECQDYEKVASRGIFYTDPRRAWGFWASRLGLYRRAQPHAGYAVVADLARRCSMGGWVFTSNVDGYFKRSGFDAYRIVECHGSIEQVQCIGPLCSHTGPAFSLDGEEVQPATETWTAPMPMCPSCGEMLRPNVLMFDDGPNWRGGRYDLQQKRLDEWLSGVTRLVVLDIGAGTVIPTVRKFGQRQARTKQGRLVRVNPDAAVFTGGEDVALRTTAQAALLALRALAI